MKSNYVSLSLELHLFFARIMKEHSLFLMAGFPAKNEVYANKADWFREQFEGLLQETVMLSNNRVGADVLRSGEVITEFTLGAERRTSFLTGIQIDSRITEAERFLRPGWQGTECTRMGQMVGKLNKKALKLTEELINFKEKILKEMKSCQLFTFNYPLLIEHIIREAKLYVSLITELETKGTITNQDMWKTENFWNQIMMEHALFIRGLLDPTEEKLIDTADEFSEQYKELLEEAKRKDCMATEELRVKSLKETVRLRDFKAAGTRGITDCEIAGLILPLLADHVLREANHYLRLLGSVRQI